jgi:hypothetical protein
VTSLNESRSELDAMITDIELTLVQHHSRCRAHGLIETSRSRSHHVVIRVYDDAGNVIETHEHKCDFKER